MTTQKFYSKVTISALPGSEIEIKGSIDADIFTSYRNDALAYLGKNIEIPGFRKGNTPEKVLISKIGEAAVLEEMAELALAKAYPEIVINEKIDAIGKPTITITKLAPGNPLEFTAKTAIIPTITLSDYKSLAKDIIKKPLDIAEVTEADIETAIKEIQKRHAHDKLHENGHDQDHQTLSKEDHDKAVEALLPEFNDAFVQTLGEFASVADFKTKLTDNLKAENTIQAKDKRRAEIADSIIAKSEVDLPRILIESEVRRIEAQFTDDLERVGIKLDDYLAHLKKTIDELRKDWEPSATKKAKLQLVLNKIASEEKLIVPKEKIQAQVDIILKTYKDADPERAWVFAETYLTNEAVFEFLEGVK